MSELLSVSVKCVVDNEEAHFLGAITMASLLNPLQKVPVTIGY